MEHRPKRVTWVYLVLMFITLFCFWNSLTVIEHSASLRAPTGAGLEAVASDPPAPLILFWTDFFSQRFDTLDALETLSHCPEVICQISTNRSDVNRSAAVLLHPRDMQNVIDIPDFRQPHQYYVFYLLESPFHTGLDLDVFTPEFFNLTFTYRQDSDIVSDHYFKNYRPPLWKSPTDFEKLWSRKTKFAAYFESYCFAPSMRRLIVNELRTMFPIDIYGKCGTLKCETFQQARCDQLLASYKFFFAFENSVCQDYVTEKIYRALNSGVIPVVFGGANYSAIFPPGSFVNVLDFPSVNHLAQHLNYVSNSKPLYASYFKWRFVPMWQALRGRLRSRNLSWCSLCRLLNQDEKPIKSVASIKAWWEKPGVCSSPLHFMSGVMPPMYG